MKIDSNRPNFDTTPAGKIGAAGLADAKRASGSAARTGADQVSVSADAKFASSAIDAAHRAPDVRREKVERAKALLADGKIGNDPHRLADALIDKTIDISTED